MYTSKFKDLYFFKGHKKEVRCVTTMPFEGILALVSGSEDKTIKIWNPELAENKVLKSLENGSTVWALHYFKMNGEDLLASTYFEEVKIWNPSKNGHFLFSMGGHELPTVCLTSINVEGITYIASGSYDTNIKLWNPNVKTSDRKLSWSNKSYSLVNTLKGHDHYICDLITITYKEEKCLVSSSIDKTIKLWSPLDTNEESYNIMTLTGHSNGVYSLCFFNLKGEDLIVSGSYDQKIKVWNPNIESEKKQVMELLDHGDCIWKLSTAIVDGDLFIISSGEDNTINIWNPLLENKLVRKIRHDGVARFGIYYKFQGEDSIVSNSLDELQLYK